MHAAGALSGSEVSAILATIEWEFERMRRPLGVSERGAHEMARRSCMCWSVQCGHGHGITQMAFGHAELLVVSDKRQLERRG
jgi:hypothetical protein